jgi:predicted alpha/beta-hydrolase family hydrolase
MMAKPEKKRKPAPSDAAEKIRFAVDEQRSVSGLLLVPPNASSIYVFAHGAGAGMAHPFMVEVSALLAERGIATLRYQFPYMEAGSRRPDSPAVAHAAVRAAVTEARRRSPDLPVFAGGKSFGGRMTSQAEAGGPMGISGVVFFGFPLHPPGAPDDKRGDHLSEVEVPLLFLQGTRDEFAEPALLRPLLDRLGPKAQAHWIEGGNHSFGVPAKSGRKTADVLAELCDVFLLWTDTQRHTRKAL